MKCAKKGEKFWKGKEKAMVTILYSYESLITKIQLKSIGAKFSLQRFSKYKYLEKNMKISFPSLLEFSNQDALLT